MKLGKFLKMIDAYTDVTKEVIITREFCTKPLLETKLIYVGYEAIPYEDSKVIEFGFHNDQIHITIK